MLNTLENAQGRPLMKKNCLSLLRRPEPGANREMKPETWTSIALGDSQSTSRTLSAHSPSRNAPPFQGRSIRFNLEIDCHWDELLSRLGPP